MSQSSFGDFVIRIGASNVLDTSTPTFEQGSTGNTMSAYIYSTETDVGRTLASYNLGFDFDFDGLGFNPAFDINTFAVTGPGSPQLTVNPAAINYDFAVGGSGLSVLLDDFDSPTDAFKLFDFTFDIGAAPVGTYDFAFQSPSNVPFIFPPPGGVLDTNQTTGTAADGGPTGIVLSPVGGQFNVTAVPEPSSMLALAGLFAAGGVRRWRTKKRGRSEVAVV